MSNSDYMWQVYGILPEPDPIYGHGYDSDEEEPLPLCNEPATYTPVDMSDLNDDIPF